MEMKPKIYKGAQGHWVVGWMQWGSAHFEYFHSWRSAISWCSAALYRKSMGEFKVVNI